MISDLIEISPVNPIAADHADHNRTFIPVGLRAAISDDPHDFQLYAVLDAAKIMHLPERLVAADVPHKCLFVGKAMEDYSDVAPWLVQLPLDHELTRDLFSQGDDYPHLWDAYSGIFIQTAQAFDPVWTHCRKFIMMQDSAEKWVFFRFWEPSTFRALTDIDRQLEPWLTRFFSGFRYVWPDPETNGERWFTFDLSDTKTPDHVKLAMGLPTLTALNAAVRERDLRKDLFVVRDQLNTTDMQHACTDAYLTQIRAWLMSIGFPQPTHIPDAPFGLARRFPEGIGNMPDALLQILTDTRKGPGVRLWHIENWRETL